MFQSRSRVALTTAVCVAAVAATLAGQQAKTHRLEATPTTVAYGYYDAAAKPVLRIASGDIIDVDTLLTNTPGGPDARRRARRPDPGVAARRSSTR